MAESRPNITIRFVHDVPALTAYVAFLSGQGEPTVLQSLARIEAHMKTFEEIVAKLESSLTEWNDRELKEDADSVLTKAENTRLAKELADAKALIPTPEQLARFEAALKAIEDSNKIPSDVIPGPVDPEPEPGPVVEEEPPVDGGPVVEEEV